MLVPIHSASEKRLINTPIKKLALKLEDSDYICKQVKIIYKELEEKGFTLFRPHLYLGDEWFSPDGEVAISIPFYLAHPKLVALEKKHTGEAEGGKKKLFLALLRHEIGHCIDHAYKLSKSKEWKLIFGDPKKKVYDPDNYSFDPSNRDFVENLGEHYAQAHPDEDFAETFAVWLEIKKNDWKKLYKSSPKALEKLSYVDRVMKTLKDKQAHFASENLICSANSLRISLKTYYHRKRKQLTA